MNDLFSEIQRQELQAQKPLKSAVESTIGGERQLFLPILNSPMTQNLSRIIDKPLAIDPVTREGKVEEGSLTVFISGCQELFSPRSSVIKLLDMFRLELTKQNTYRADGAANPDVTLSLDRYMELCGLDSSKKALKDKTRRRVHEDLNLLYNLSMEWKDPQGGKWGDFKKARICTVAQLEKGVMRFSFEPKLADMLNRSFIGFFNLAIFRLDDRNKNAYALARKLQEHASMKRNIERGTDSLLSVSAMLSFCPGIPSYQKVAETDRAFNRRIREPLENTLDYIQQEGILSWEYCNAKSAPLTEEQIASSDWKTYSGFYIRFTFKDAPSREGWMLTTEAKRAPKKRKPKK